MTVLGLDIGGANLKAADARGTAVARPFEVWRHSQRLAEALGALIDGLPGRYDTLAVTMTAELCDCFRTKRAGVDAVLDAVEAVAAGREVRVWRTDGRFVGVAEARAAPLLTAASNWAALAALVAEGRPGRTLLIDVGSTTADCVPLRDGMSAARGMTDPERLAAGELVYTGVRRTPVCAAVRTVPWRGAEVPVAAELFATTLDAHLLLGNLPADPDDRGTADGRPATREFAAERLARVICADAEMLSADEIRTIAAAVAERQAADLRAAVSRVTAGWPPGWAAVVSGAGEFLARAALPAGTPVTSLRDTLGAALSEVAPAYAVAVLADRAASLIPRTAGSDR